MQHSMAELSAAQHSLAHPTPSPAQPTPAQRSGKQSCHASLQPCVDKCCCLLDRLAARHQLEPETNTDLQLAMQIPAQQTIRPWACM